MAEVFSTYESAIEWLQTDLAEKSRLHKGVSGFEDSSKLFEHLGNPQEDRPTIHIAGTSGKGSVAWLASKLLVSNGKRVGTIMSPHVYDFRERFLVDCDKVATSTVLESVNELSNAVKELRDQNVYVSYFQAVVALGYLVFSKENVDTVVVEVGIGGKLDATNHIERDKIAVITTIGYDHADVLGDSLTDIAEQKAGIITSASRVVALSQSEDINRVIKSRARELTAEVQWVDNVDDYIETNAQLAKAAVEALLARPIDQKIKQLADDFSLPGRFEIREKDGKMIILDGAHNEQKICALVGRLKNKFPNKKFSVLLAVAEKRTNQEVVKTLSSVAAEIVFTKYAVLAHLPTKAAQDFTEVKLEWLDVPNYVINDQTEALAHLEGKDMLVTGSFYLVGEIGARLS